MARAEAVGLTEAREVSQVLRHLAVTPRVNQKQQRRVQTADVLLSHNQASKHDVTTSQAIDTERSQQR